MNWREWRLLQSHAGWLAVTTATVRIVSIGPGTALQHGATEVTHISPAKAVDANMGLLLSCIISVILSLLCVVPPLRNRHSFHVALQSIKFLAKAACLCCLQVHVLLLGAPWWPAAREDWPQMIPTITLMSTLPPMALLLLKGLLVLPPVSIVLSRIRSGVE
jgi:hypothetical protein